MLIDGQQTQQYTYRSERHVRKVISRSRHPRVHVRSGDSQGYSDGDSEHDHMASPHIFPQFPRWGGGKSIIILYNGFRGRWGIVLFEGLLRSGAVDKPREVTAPRPLKTRSYCLMTLASENIHWGGFQPDVWTTRYMSAGRRGLAVVLLIGLESMFAVVPFAGLSLWVLFVRTIISHYSVEPANEHQPSSLSLNLFAW